MKNNSQKNKLYLVIIILIIVIFTLIVAVIKISNTNNKIKQQEEKQRQQLGETTSDNAYISMETHLLEINDATKVDESVAAIADNITEGKKAWVNGELITGNGADNNYYRNKFKEELFDGSNIYYSTNTNQVCRYYRALAGEATGVYDVYFLFNSASTVTYTVSHERGGLASKCYGTLDCYDSSGNLLASESLGHMKNETVTLPNNTSKIHCYGQIGDSTTVSTGCMGTLTITVN